MLLTSRIASRCIIHTVEKTTMLAASRPVLRSAARSLQITARRGYAEEAAASSKLKLTLAMPHGVSSFGRRWVLHRADHWTICNFFSSLHPTFGIISINSLAISLRFFGSSYRFDTWLDGAVFCAAPHCSPTRPSTALLKCSKSMSLQRLVN